jgi:hypothetical protein
MPQTLEQALTALSKHRPRTPKQQEAWKRRCALGAATGLPRWIDSQVRILDARPELDNERKKTIRWAAWYLKQQLGLAANELRTQNYEERYKLNMAFLDKHLESKG